MQLAQVSDRGLPGVFTDLKVDEHENTRRMVKVSIILIDYITSLNDSNPRNNSLFLEILKATTFDPDLTAMLRYSLGRIFDLFYRQDRFWFVEIVNLYEGHPSHPLVALSAMQDSMHAHSLNLLMMRTFEALVLRRTDGVSFLQSIFKNGMMNTRMENVDTADHQGRAMYTRLAKIYIHVLVDLPQPEYGEKDFSDFYTAMKAFDWRPLSQVKSDFKGLEVGESIRAMRGVLAGILRKEMDDASYYTTECTQTAGPWEWMLDIVNLDIKAAGKAIRDARLAVKVGKIPRAVVKTADHITPSELEPSLRKLSIGA